MTIKLFALGRPGSGKTTAVRHVIELARRRGYSAIREKEYTILYKMFEQEKATSYQYFRPTKYSGFDICDFSVLDSSVDELEKNIQERVSERKYDIVTIELARNDYRKALSRFSPNFLSDAYFLFVEADVETCIQRIHRRLIYPPSSDHPPVPDHHFVSDHILRSHYGSDNWTYMAHNFQEEYSISKSVLVYRNISSLDTFLEQVSNFAELIFREVHEERIAYPLVETKA